MDKNNYNDFSITIDSITDNKASLTLKALSETFPLGERTVQQQQKSTVKKLVAFDNCHYNINSDCGYCNYSGQKRKN